MVRYSACFLLFPLFLLVLLIVMYIYIYILLCFSVSLSLSSLSSPPLFFPEICLLSGVRKRVVSKRVVLADVPWTRKTGTRATVTD